MKKNGRKFRFRIGQKLACSCMLLCLLIGGILSAEYYKYSKSALDEQIEQYISDMVQQTGYNIQTVMDDVQSVIFDIQKDEAVQAYLTARAENQPADGYENYVMKRAMTDAVYQYILYNDNIEQVLIVPESGILEAVSKVSRGYIRDTTIKKPIYEAGGSPVWFGADRGKDYVTVGVQINSVQNMKALGYLVMQVPVRKFTEIFEGLTFVKNGSIFIMNQDGNIILGDGPQFADAKLKNVYSDMIHLSQGKKNFQVFSNGGNKNYVTHTMMGYKNWHLMAVIPSISYTETISGLKGGFLIIFVIMAAVAAVMTMLIATYFTRPIKKLVDAMQKFGDGDFNVMCTVSSSDEIGLLSRTFNMMVYNINELIEKVYSETMLKQEAELKSLRMQINPHFLYNTLETINWMAREKGVPEVGRMARALGDMMHYTINGTDFTTVKDEIDNIKNYFMIQQTRYEDRIQFLTQVPEELYSYRIPRLILQPLIENSIIHGVEDMDQGGRIEVRGFLKDNCLHLHVIDNGKGVSQEKIRELLSRESTIPGEGRTSIGARNVNYRLKLYYGEQRGLEIQSIQGVGTEMAIAIPLKDAIGDLKPFDESSNAHSSADTEGGKTHSSAPSL